MGASNTPPGLKDPADEKEIDNFEFTDDEYLLSELPFVHGLDTEDKNFEQE